MPLEAAALRDAVRAHCEDRVLLHGRRAIVFPPDRVAAPPQTILSDTYPLC